MDKMDYINNFKDIEKMYVSVKMYCDKQEVKPLFCELQEGEKKFSLTSLASITALGTQSLK